MTGTAGNSGSVAVQPESDTLASSPLLAAPTGPAVPGTPQRIWSNEIPQRNLHFTGRVDEMAQLFGAWAPGAVANADLSFETRLEAVKSPERLKGQAYVDQAIGLLVSARDLDPDAAEKRLEWAAARAGVSVSVLAKAIVAAFGP